MDAATECPAPKCPGAQVPMAPKCPGAQVPRRPSAKAPKCPGARAPKCPGGQVPRLPSAHGDQVPSDPKSIHIKLKGGGKLLKMELENILFAHRSQNLTVVYFCIFRKVKGRNS